MNSNSQIRLYTDIVYRKYENRCYAWKTSKQKVMLFDEMAFELFEIIGYGYFPVSNMFKLLSSLYELDDDGEHNLIDFISFLAENEIVEVDTVYEKENDDVEIEIDKFTAQKHILYSVMFELTYACNERCKHCYVDSQDSRPFLETKEILNIIDQIANINATNILFSGGDIFTRDDSVQIIEYATSKHLLVDVYTNGIALDDAMIFRLAKLHLRSVQCSVYGSNPIIHDGITGVDGSFVKTIDTLQKFSLCGIPVCMKVVLMKDNIADYENIITLSKKLGIPAQFSTSIRPTMRGDTKPTELRIDKNDTHHFIASQNYGKRRPSIKEINISEELICRSGFNSLTIDPFGDVYICASLGKSIGNVKEIPIANLWNNSKELLEWRSYRQKDLEDCAQCKLLPYCHFCPAQAFLENGKWNKPYQEACDYAMCNYEILSDLSNV